MKYLFALLLLAGSLLLNSAPLSAQANTPSAAPDTVVVFLAEKCPICQFYAKPLRDLHADFGRTDQNPNGAVFLGYFPMPYASEEKAARFEEIYQIPFPCQVDSAQRWTKRLDAQITPEVFVLHQGEVVYRGRINDQYVRLGRRRPEPRKRDVQEVLEALAKGETPEVDDTQPLGCAITRLNAAKDE